MLNVDLSPEEIEFVKQKRKDDIHEEALKMNRNFEYQRELDRRAKKQYEAMKKQRAIEVAHLKELMDADTDGELTYDHARNVVTFHLNDERSIDIKSTRRDYRTQAYQIQNWQWMESRDSKYTNAKRLIAKIKKTKKDKAASVVESKREVDLAIEVVAHVQAMYPNATVKAGQDIRANSRRRNVHNYVTHYVSIATDVGTVRMTYYKFQGKITLNYESQSVKDRQVVTDLILKG